MKDRCLDRGVDRDVQLVSTMQQFLQYVRAAEKENQMYFRQYQTQKKTGKKVVELVENIQKVQDQIIEKFDRDFVSSVMSQYISRKTKYLSVKQYDRFLNIYEKTINPIKIILSCDNQKLLEEIEKIQITYKASMDNFSGNFLSSIATQIKRNKILSEKQMNTYRKIKTDLDSNKDWAVDFQQDEEKKRIWKVLADFILHSYSSTKYYTSLYQQLCNKPDCIPSKYEYEKLTANKYLQGVVERASDPKYQNGDLVRFRQNSTRPALVVNNNPARQNYISSARGSRFYEVIFLNDSTNVVTTVEERDIKLLSRKGRGKKLESK